jgi:hypothetical protein
MALEIAVRLETTATVETQVDVIVEEAIVEAPPPEAARPESKSESAASPPKPADANERLKNRFFVRELADEDREQKAEKGEANTSGAGKDKALTAPPQDSSDRRESEDTRPEPNKEISHLVPPAAPTPVSRTKTRIAPPGPLKQPAAKSRKPDEKATQDEATMKRQNIECGAKAKVAFEPSPRTRQGQVLGRLTKDQADRMIQVTQAYLDMLISPRYLDNMSIFVHLDGTREGAWIMALLPAGLSVQAGDRVEMLGAHLDPSALCHYIPTLVLRVL